VTDNSAEREIPASAYTRSVPGLLRYEVSYVREIPADCQGKLISEWHGFTSNLL